jgi:hypothetical protein
MKQYVFENSKFGGDKTMKRTWTTVGKDFERIIVDVAIRHLDWQEIPKGGHLEAPAMPGLGIKAAIRELHIPKVSHVAWSSHLAPYGFYGIRGHYTNGDAEVYIVDLGTHLVPVCSDFHAHDVFYTHPEVQS